MNRLLLSGLVAFNLCPAALMAQKKEDLQSIQRDVAQLQEQVKELQRSQDERIGSLQAMLQQSVDASNKVAAGLVALQRDIESKLSDQQNKVVAPVASLGTRLDQTSDDLRSVATNVADLVRRMSALDTKLTDISSAIRILQTPAAAAPPAPGTSQVQIPGAAATPPAPSADSLWENARRDYSGGKFDLALQEYSDYLRYYPDTDNAPAAAYYIGYIYYNASQFDDSVKAFDKVLAMPENPKSADSLYYKAVALMKSDHRTDAGVAFKEFVKKYPHNEHAAMAHTNLRNLGLEARTTKKRPE
ncbi:MAG TPA: tetratricopeptide repeat protein [Bryobacteraceae bacterium]|nr:tetratricopeptide repeat protein [Bryobacteraceae bacterium]